MRFSTILLAILIAECCAAEVRSAEPITLSDLRAGDVLQLSYTSRGCFNFDGIELTFLRTTNTAVSVAQVEFQPDKRAKEPKRLLHAVGDLTLSDADVAGFDRFLRRVRAPAENWNMPSTTVEQIVITQKRGSEIIATEQFKPSEFMKFPEKELHIADLMVRLKFPSVVANPK